MARRRGRNSGRSTTFWHGITFSGVVNTSGETFAIISNTLMLEWGPVTLLRMRVEGFMQSPFIGESPSVCAISFRKIVLDRAGDTPSNIGGSLIDGSYLSSEQILHFGVYTYDTSGTVAGALSTRPVGGISIDVKAKRRFQEENEQLVLDIEQLGTGAADGVNLTLAMRLLLMPH